MQGYTIASLLCTKCSNNKIRKICIKMTLLISFVIALSTASAVLSQTVTPAPICSDEVREDNCTLPNCRCSGWDIPGNLTRQETPQIVFLTFDDAVNIANFDFYADIFSNRKNPNNEPITGTFFVSHEYTNYSMVHELWRNGHDIALHSISHQTIVQYWTNLNETGWKLELSDQREQMAHFAKIPVDEIQGMRAPFLQGGGDTMYRSLQSGGFTWESSRPTLQFRKDNGLWPYTNDYKSDQDCQIAPCPVGSYPGFWTVPMVDMLGDDQQGCSMADSCKPVPETVNATFDLLHKNFQDHYTGNRAPFGIFTHAAWLNGTGTGDEIWQRRLGYIQFLDYLATLDDVYIVGISRAIEWIKAPTPLNRLDDFPPFKVEVKPTECPSTCSCVYKPDPNLAEKWFRSCVNSCPSAYPWLGNPLGE